MEVFTQLRYDPGPWLLAPLGVLLLVSAWFRRGRGTSFVGSIICGLAALCLAFTPLRQQSGALAWMLVMVSICVDALRDRSWSKWSVVGLLALISALSAYTWNLSGRGWPRSLILDEENVVFQNLGDRTVVGKHGTRIVEFGDAPNRDWHLKDGREVISLTEGTRFRSSRGPIVNAEDVVVKVEAWAKVKRIAKPREALVAAR